jgi:hypothetical protein
MHINVKFIDVAAWYSTKSWLVAVRREVRKDTISVNACHAEDGVTSRVEAGSKAPT